MQDKESLWNDEKIIRILRFLSNNTPSWTDKALKKYLKALPLLEDNSSTSKQPESTKTSDDKPNDSAKLELLQANSRSNLLESNNRSLALELMQTKAQLAQASSSPGMNRIEGFILGFGLACTFYYFLLWGCTPCVNHFEPTPSMSAVFSFFCLIGTLGALRYAHSSKSIPMFIEQAGGHLVSTAVKTKILYNNLSNIFQSSESKSSENNILKSSEQIKNPWTIFMDSMSEKQAKLLNEHNGIMLYAVYNGDMEKVRAYIIFHHRYTKLGITDGDDKENRENFDVFMKTLDQTQRALLVKGLEYLGTLISSEKKTN